MLDTPADDVQVLAISIGDGIGACRVALDVLNAKLAGYISVEENPQARRVVEGSFGSTLFVDSTESITEEVVKDWACQFSRAGIVLLCVGSACASANNRPAIVREIPRIRELIEKYFSWASHVVLAESVASRADCLDAFHRYLAI